MVQTDHHNLQCYISTKALSGRQAKWWETLSGFHMDIVYCARKKILADALGRRPYYML
jgi:hypothetical protein